jgi:rubrerythrin
VFEELAKDELKHKAFILRVKKGETLRPSPEEIVDLKISDYLAEAKPSANMDYQKALTIAMQREKESFKLYNRLTAMCKEEDIKSTFLALAQEEAKHKLRLEVIYDEDILKEN